MVVTKEKDDLRKEICSELEGLERMTCGNCGTKYYEGQHDEILCAYLNR